MIKSSKYTYRQIVNVVVEASTPIAVGSGNKGVLTDDAVLIDVNGLPYIPGTTIAGVLRHALGEEFNDIFGWQGVSSDDSHGSDIIFSEARILGKSGQVIDGIADIDWTDSYYSRFKNLPIRNHVRIGAKGTAEDQGKFDEQIVFKGTRFAFAFEVLSDGANLDRINAIINKLYDPAVRFGGGTRKGFGELKVVKICRKCFDLTVDSDLSDYLDKSSKLISDFEPDTSIFTAASDMVEYRLALRPIDFFLFSSGYGDDDADITPVKEPFIEWVGESPHWVDAATLIPASSLKGALAHRIAYHWNKNNSRVAGTANKPLTGIDNPAVRSIFGYANDNDAVRGKAVFSDILVKDSSIDKVLDHVALDRFTGGVMSGALYSEKTVYGNGSVYHTSIYVDRSVDNESINAFESALNDLCLGLLPLGGGNNRGNGIFKGEYKKFD